MDPKSTLVKSKSSNSAISKKSEESSRRQNKKTRSNADFPCHGLKKRGVYVEKRSTKTNLENSGKEVECIPQKPPPRPRPGQKRFLASVLSILSKSTTGTQYPDPNEVKKERKLRDKEKNKYFLKQISDEDGANVNEMKDTKKFKSRILNKKFVREDKKKMVVLQSKKEIAQTPSNYSEWSYKDASQYSNVSNLMIHEDSDNRGGLNIADELKNAVLEGRNLKVKKLRYHDKEPKTLVSDGQKAQKNLYNFFVDLLETTISVYNVKAEYDSAGPIDASKTNLQINESVANKLNVGKARKAVEFDDGVVTPQCLHYIKNETVYERNFPSSTTKPITVEPIEVPIKPKLKKVKGKSRNTNNNRTPPPKSKSVEVSRRTTFRNKSDLINVLKQELEVNTHAIEEPRSIYQALRVMARNKKKISFEPYVDLKNFTDECVLKRRKVISSRKVRKNVKDNAVNNVTRPAKPIIRDYMQDTSKHTDARYKDVNSAESYHSLEVYGFDYEPKTPKNTNFKAKEVVLTYHSSNSELDFDVHDAMLNPSSAFSSIRKFSAVVD